MASFPSSNDHILGHFDNIHLKLSKHAKFEVRFHSMLSKYETTPTAGCTTRGSTQNFCINLAFYSALTLLSLLCIVLL